MPKGGKREGSGRKSKAEELELQTKLDPMEDDFLSALHKQIKKGHPLALKMYAEYRFGKPTDKVDVTSAGKAIGSEPHVVIFKDYSKDAQP
jgi:hypothetical protein